MQSHQHRVEILAVHRLRWQSKLADDVRVPLHAERAESFHTSAADQAHRCWHKTIPAIRLSCCQIGNTQLSVMVP